MTQSSRRPRGTQERYPPASTALAVRTAIGVPGAVILEDPRDDAYTVSVKALMARHPGWVEGPVTFPVYR